MNIPICIDKIYFIKQVLQSNIAGIEYNTWKHNSSKNWHRERVAFNCFQIWGYLQSY